MWVMASGTWGGALFVGLALIAACDEDGEGDVPATTGSARGTPADATADDASRPVGAVVRVDDGGAQGAAADASALDGGLDASLLDGGLDASLDGAVGDAMPSPMPIEDASFDARAGTGGFGGPGGRGGAGGAAGVGGF
jgi:hypothetical protein